MYEPIFHRFITGSAAVIGAISTMKIANAIEDFCIHTKNRLQQFEHNANRVTEGIERGMNKYAPPPKDLKK
jgi:hypothetical protein